MDLLRERNPSPIAGYIEPSTGKLNIGRSSWYNYSSVIESLRAFASSGVIEEGKKIVLVLDNAPWHKKAVRLVFDEKLPEYADIRECMDVIYLPVLYFQRSSFFETLLIDDTLKQHQSTLYQKFHKSLTDAFPDIHRAWLLTHQHYAFIMIQKI